jgi:hypothetical protein
MAERKNVRKTIGVFVDESELEPPFRCGDISEKRGIGKAGSVALQPTPYPLAPQTVPSAVRVKQK